MNKQTVPLKFLESEMISQKLYSSLIFLAEEKDLTVNDIFYIVNDILTNLLFNLEVSEESAIGLLDLMRNAILEEYREVKNESKL